MGQGGLAAVIGRGVRSARARFAARVKPSVVAAALCGGLAQAVVAQPAPELLRPCRLPGVEHEALCGQVMRPLDPASTAGQGSGRQIAIHFAVLPALARNKHADPVWVFAGGPGQSAIELAGVWARLLARLNNRRDIVLVDQRGTGRSAKLACPEVAPTAPLSTVLPEAAQRQRLQACREALERLPHGDLRHYGTAVAMTDMEAVRRALGAPRLNLVGASYGTRAALEFLRQYPQAVRRVVLDGVAPPDMVLPAAFAQDNQAALEAVFKACEADARGCAAQHPRLRAQWAALLQSLPKEATVAHPFTGVPERLTLTREVVLGWVRGPLYVPALASALPVALSQAAAGRWEALVGLASALGGSRAASLAEGQHFSVICTEDVPRLGAAAAGASEQAAPGADFGPGFAMRYQSACEHWPRGTVPPEFYRVAPSAAPVLVLSGGADPATPPRHGERVAQALGPRARHVVVAEAGHGVMALPCMREVLYRFMATDDDAQALLAGPAGAPIDCAAAVPRPPAFAPPGAAAAAAQPGGVQR